MRTTRPLNVPLSHDKLSVVAALGARAPRLAASAFWLGLVPSIMAWLVMRYLVPSPEVGGAFEHTVGRIGKDHPLPAVVGLFLLSSLAVRYWRSVLRGRLGRDTSARSREAPMTAVSRIRAAVRFVLTMAVAAASALFVKQSVLESSEVLTGSMLPTLEPGDRVAVNKVAYGLRLGEASERVYAPRAPKRGELIVFRNPTADGPTLLVKRVIGVPGDRIGMHGPIPVINGWQVPICDVGVYVHADFNGSVAGRIAVEFLGDREHLILLSGLAPTFDATYEVKPGEVFVLGDNRNTSVDARQWTQTLGHAVSAHMLQGRVDWFLSGTHRDGSADWTRLFHTPRADFHLEKLNTSQLEEGLSRCLAARPVDTVPPPPR